MEINPFALERFFAEYEFSSRYLLSSSDCEPVAMAELVEMADDSSASLWDGLKLGYTESMGHPLLREEIAVIYSGIDAPDTLVAAPEELIFLFMHALLEAGDHVVCTFPGYQSLYEVARSIGCRVSRWEPDEGSGWCFDLDQLRGHLRPETRLIVVNFPHNPTGYLPSHEEFTALIELAKERDIYLLSDEMYRFLELESGSALPSGCELYQRAFALSGLSKSFGMPGLRMGWVVGRDRDILERMAGLKDYTTICSSAPGEILALIALRNREQIVEQQLGRLRGNVSNLDIFFDKYQHVFSWNPPRGGSICFPRMLAVEDTYVFCIRLVEESGIMLAPSRIFEYGDRHVRIGFGREDLPDVLDRFGDYLDGGF